MFYINGIKTDVKDVIERFGVFIPDTPYGVMELDDSQVREDRINGGIKHTVEKAVTTVFRTTDPKSKEDLEIAYSKATPRKKGDTLNYIPRKIIFAGHKMRFDMKTQLGEWVAFWISPRHKDSPFNRGKEAFWKVFDAESKAKDQLKKDDLLTDCLIAVRDMDENTLRHKARGMGIDLTDMKEAQIRASLTARAKTDSQKFLDDLASDVIEWKGKIKEAIEKGVFVQEVINGMPRWHWGKGDMSGKEICIITKGSDPFEFLIEAIANGDLAIYREQLKRIGNKESVDKSIEKQLGGDISFQGMIEMLVEKGRIEFENGNAYWNTSKGRTGEIGIATQDTLISLTETDAKLKKRITLAYNLNKNK